MKIIYRRFTPDEIDIIRWDFAAYVPVTEIAKRIGHSVGTVRQKILSLGLTRDSRVTCALRYAPPELVARRAEMTNDEFVAEAKKWRAGINRRHRAARDIRVRAALDAIAAGDGSRPKKMRAMRDAGATLEEIGARFGITRERVRQVTSDAYVRRQRAKTNGRAAPIKTILRMWKAATPAHRAAFLKEIGAKMVEPELVPDDWSILM